MPHVNTEKTFDALEIRDTSSHNGDVINNYDFQLKTIIIHNHLNQQVTLQCQASIDDGLFINCKLQVPCNWINTELLKPKVNNYNIDVICIDYTDDILER